MNRSVLVLGAWMACATVVCAEPMPVAEVGLLPGDVGVGPATNSQQDHTVAKGGNQYLVAWGDSRGRSSGSQTVQSDGDIFGIRLDAQGNPIDAVPFLIAGGMGLQQRPQVAWNGQDWLVLYVSQDPVGGYYEDQLRAVRVSPQGQVLDANPILFPPTQFTPNTIGLQVAGQDGQWLVTRCIYHSDGYGTYLAGQRIGSDGQLLDSTPQVLIDWVYGQSRTLVANGEYLVVGPDWSDSSTIKARRIGTDLQPVGATFTVPSLNIATNGSEFYVVWTADFVNLVGSRMTSTGTLLNPAGTIIVTDFSQYHHANLAHDGAQWWLEWGASDTLRTVRINAAGAVLDPGGGVLLPIVIGGNISTAYSPLLAPRTGGGVHVFWYDVRVALGYDANVFVLPVSSGNIPGTERCVSTGTMNQRNPDFSAGPGATSAVVFVSEEANDDRVLVHMLDSSGIAMAPEPIEVFRGPTVGKAGIAWNGLSFMVTWDQGASGLTPTVIKARRLNPDGSFIDASPIDVMPGFSPDVEALGSDFLVAGSRFGTYPQFIDLWASRIDGATGARLDGPNGVILAGGYVNGMARVRTDGTQWLVAAHAQWSHDSSQGDAILAMVPPVGAPEPAFNPTPLAGGTGDLDIAFSGSTYLLVWRNNTLANANNYVAGRIMHADGTFGPMFTIAEAAGRQLRPTVSWDGDQFIVAWDDQRNQDAFFDARTDVYATRVTQAGTVVDNPAFAVLATPDGNASPSLLSRNDGTTLVASTRFVTTAGFNTYRVGITRLGTTPVTGDAHGDGVVDGADLSVLLAQFGSSVPPGSGADFNGDGLVNGADLSVLLARFGTGG